MTIIRFPEEFGVIRLQYVDPVESTEILYCDDCLNNGFDFRKIARAERNGKRYCMICLSKLLYG